MTAFHESLRTALYIDKVSIGTLKAISISLHAITDWQSYYHSTHSSPSQQIKLQVLSTLLNYLVYLHYMCFSKYPLRLIYMAMKMQYLRIRLVSCLNRIKFFSDQMNEPNAKTSHFRRNVNESLTIWTFSCLGI